MVRRNHNLKSFSVALWRQIRRPLRWVSLALVAVVLVLILVLLVPSIRGHLLRTALGQAHRFLPGEVSFQAASWPGMGRLEFTDLAWLVSPADSLSGKSVGDTLAFVADLSVDLDLHALVKGDLDLHEVRLSAGPVDVPGIVSVFPVAGVDSLVETASADPVEPSDFFGIPSLAVGDLKIEGSDIMISEELVLDRVRVQAGVQLLADQEPRILLDEGMVRGRLLQEETLSWVVDNLALDLSADREQREFRLELLQLRVPEAGTPEILESWRRSSPVQLKIQGEGQWTEAGLGGNLDLTGDLPGLAHVRSLLSENFPAELLGPLKGTIELGAVISDFSEPDPTLDFSGDFSESAWLDRLILKGGLQNGRARVDSLDISLRGVHLAARGWVDTTAVDLNLKALVDDPFLVRTFGGETLAEAEVGLDLKAAVIGNWPLPTLDVDIQAQASTPDWSVPSLRTLVTAQGEDLVLNIEADQGLKYGATVVDSLSLNWDGNLSRLDSISHRFDLGLWAPQGRVALAGSGLLDSLRTINLDSLVVVGMDSTMRTHQPAVFVQGPGPRDLIVEDFLLEGGLGTLGLDCRLNETELDLQLVCDLLFREELLMMVAPSAVWHRRGGSDLAVQVNVDVEVTDAGPVMEGRVGTALIPHQQDNPDLGADLTFFLTEGDSSGLGVDLLLHSEETSLMEGSFRWPGRPDLESGNWLPDPERGFAVKIPRQKFDLALLNPILPPKVMLQGVLDFGLDLIEPPRTDEQAGLTDWSKIAPKTLVDGYLGFDQLSVSLPRSSDIHMHLETDISGSLAYPMIKGDVVIGDGFSLDSVDSTEVGDNIQALDWRSLAQDLEGGAGTLNFDFQYQEDGLELELNSDLLLKDELLTALAPSEIWTRDGGVDLGLKANLNLKGGRGKPVFDGHALAVLIPHRDNPAMSVDLDFYLSQGDSSGLGADLDLRTDDQSLLNGRVLWPGKPDVASGRWVPDPLRGFELHFPRQDVDLARFNRFLPPDVLLEGGMEFGLDLVETPQKQENTDLKSLANILPNTRVDGYLGISELDVTLPNRSRVALKMETEVSGTMTDPAIKGELVVLSGFFRIPEIPQTLLPLEGESMLWMAMSDTTEVNYSGPARQAQEGPAMNDSPPFPLPDLDMKISLPGNMIINGYGLNIELVGELVATRGLDSDGVPSPILQGDIGVRKGSLNFMNNNFEMEKADISFRGAAPPNPHLNLRLTSDVSSYLIQLDITGFSDDPNLELTSKPELQESDIIAVLLFGRPANDLDSNQRGRANEEEDPAAQLRDNLAAVAVMFGGAGVKNQMTSQLGVDMMDLGSDSDGASTLVVGKFLAPKVLLKYNQSLEKSGTYFMTLEYALSKYFQLISTYGQGEESSGLELKWTRRY